MIPISILLITLSIVTTTINTTSSIKSEKNVLILNDENINNAIESNEFILINFYSPNCTYSKSFESEFSGAAENLKYDNITLGKIDATVNLNSTIKYSIYGFPIIKLFYKGKAYEYEGGRKKAQIISWLKDKINIKSKIISNSYELEELRKNKEVFLVHFGFNNLFDYLNICKKSPRYDCYHCISQDCLLLNTTIINFNTQNMDGLLAIFKQYDEGISILKSNYTEKDLYNFINKKYLPSVIDLNSSTINTIFSINDPIIYFFYNKDSDNSDSDDYQNIFYKAVRDTNHIIGVHSNERNKEQENILSFLDISSSDFPIIIIIDTRFQYKKYIYSNEIEYESIKEFIEDFQSGKLANRVISEEIPEVQDSNTYYLVGKSFNEIVYDETKDVLVNFYADWCGHCQQLHYVYEELASKLKNNQNLIIAKMDSIKNELPKLKISGYPTIYFFPANNKTHILYEGDRSIEDFIRFINEKGTFKLNIDEKEDL